MGCCLSAALLIVRFARSSRKSDVRALSGNRKQQLRHRPERVVYRDGNRSSEPMNPEPLLRINLFEPLCVQLGGRAPLD
jgi:hypothetical protein